MPPALVHGAVGPCLNALAVPNALVLFPLADVFGLVVEDDGSTLFDSLAAVLFVVLWIVLNLVVHSILKRF